MFADPGRVGFVDVEGIGVFRRSCVLPLGWKSAPVVGLCRRVEERNAITGIEESL